MRRSPYDIRGLRVSETKPSGRKYYQYDQNGDLIWEAEAGNTTKYIQALGETWAEVRTRGSESATYYHHLDHEGTTEAITDATGKLVWSGSYEAYGKLNRSNGELAFEARYTGKELDPDTGLYYFNARWYDPSLGRFVTEDPIRDGINWYAYCANNPLTNVDRNGLELTLATGAGLAFGDGAGKEKWDPDATYLLQRTPFQKSWLGAALDFLGIASNKGKVVGRLEFDSKGEYVDKEKDVAWDRVRIKDINTGKDKGGFWGFAKKDGELEIGTKAGLFGVSLFGDLSKAKLAVKALGAGKSLLSATAEMRPTLGDAVQNAATGTEGMGFGDYLLSFIPGYGSITSGKDFADSIMQGTFIQNEQALDRVQK